MLEIIIKYLFQGPPVYTSCPKMRSLLFNLLNIYFDWHFLNYYIVLFAENLFCLQGLYSQLLVWLKLPPFIASCHLESVLRWEDFPNVSPNVRHSLKMPDLASQRKLANINILQCSKQCFTFYCSVQNLTMWKKTKSIAIKCKLILIRYTQCMQLRAAQTIPLSLCVALLMFGLTLMG